MVNFNKIQGNQPLFLNHQQTIWLVQSGSLAVFTTLFEGNELLGSRRYLFSVNIGEVLLGATPKDRRGILAIAVEETQLIPLNINDFITQIQAGDRSNLTLLSRWINHWQELGIQDFPLNSQNHQISVSKIVQFHDFLFDYLNLAEIQKKQEQFKRFQEREHLNYQLKKAALGELTSVLHPRETELLTEGTPLLIAVGAVGRAMGIMIYPPTQFDTLNRVKDPLEAIANSSQFRTRRVVLTGDWWKQEYGPLLAYISLDKKPVALLPNGGNSYVLFDPVQRTRTLVTKAVAKTLLAESFMFYRPLPPRIHHAVELFQFGVKGYEKNIITMIILGILATLLGMVTPQATAILVNYAIPDSDRLLLGQIGLVLAATTMGRSAFSIAQAIL
ncbi:MAG TPA: hypothetical protein V6D21_19410 [Candidatus Obscuribacterales bacterium]